MIQVAVCDGDLGVHQKLKLYFAQMQLEASHDFHDFRVHYFQSGEDLLTHYKITGSFAFHIIIMGIELKGISGLEIAKAIRSFPDFDVQFVFVTHYPEYMLSSFEVQPFHFLVKPLERNLFIDTISRLCAYLFANDSRFVTMKSEEGYIVLRKPEIIALSKIKHYLLQNKIKVVTIHHEFCVSGTLSEYLEKINKPFKMIHRSVIINLEHVRRFTANSVIMSNGEMFPIGRSQAGTVKSAFAESLVGR